MNIAHKNEAENKVQTVADHSLATANLASRFAIEPLKGFIYDIGLLHDIGKYQQSFQLKIRKGDNRRVEHAICGAIEFPVCVKTAFARMAQFCIAGHHTGLPDGDVRDDNNSEATLSEKLLHPNKLDDYSGYKNELSAVKFSDSDILTLFDDVRTDKTGFLERYAFLTRYCFSCLTDADSLDTANFCTGREDKELKSDFKACLEKINRRFKKFICDTELQKARAEIQKQVYEKVKTDADIYLMNMPTGSGKTLCSMKFALERAVLSGRRRIIYVIPYNSIIDQTVEVFEKLFGDSAQILRHQSSFSYDDADDSEDYRKLLKNVTENWNAQIIVTTSVQFFESVYKNKRNRLRKLHNMADSIIVFDEVHMMPIPYLRPCLSAVSQITKLLNSEAVFLTATMPDFDDLVKRYASSSLRVAELVSDRTQFSHFRKGEYIDRGEMDAASLICDAQSCPSALIVVNKRKTAVELYQMASGKKYHLSTYMSAYDRQRTIGEIRLELERLYADYPDLSCVPDERRITVISTSLIEAGVDLDFHTVYRELSGLDSILQAGGRCNREGKREGARILIFSLEQVSREAKVNITKRLLHEYGDISAEDCIREYYQRLFAFYDEDIRRNTIAVDCTHPNSLPFSSYAKRFNLIESSSIAVAAAADDKSTALIEQLKAAGFTNYRELQKYTFNVYQNELEELLRQGAVREYGGVFCLTNPAYYSKETGVCFEASDYYL